MPEAKAQLDNVLSQLSGIDVESANLRLDCLVLQHRALNPEALNCKVRLTSLISLKIKS